MKRLFEVLRDNKPLDPRIFFEDKASAKLSRDAGNDKKDGVYTITPGPDHPRFRGAHSRKGDKS